MLDAIQREYRLGTRRHWRRDCNIVVSTHDSEIGSSSRRDLIPPHPSQSKTVVCNCSVGTTGARFVGLALLCMGSPSGDASIAVFDGIQTGFVGMPEKLGNKIRGEVDAFIGHRALCMPKGLFHKHSFLSRGERSAFDNQLARPSSRSLDPGCRHSSYLRHFLSELREPLRCGCFTESVCRHELEDGCIPICCNVIGGPKVPYRCQVYQCAILAIKGR
ncbi:hypothetical protein A0H81_10422 [Grifola frondosa]|uniref:Uncharacterized protein n=1 Tax=Grifola frondosa TaxID=5627 RepID=A0A1C7LZS7_GRIFR|nr:hypothetical protein A0H81_10422 [Grifola frondosa]